MKLGFIAVSNPLIQFGWWVFPPPFSLVIEAKRWKDSQTKYGMWKSSWMNERRDKVNGNMWKRKIKLRNLKSEIESNKNSIPFNLASFPFALFNNVSTTIAQQCSDFLADIKWVSS